MIEQPTTGKNIVESAIEAGRNINRGPMVAKDGHGTPFMPFIVLSDGEGKERVEYLSRILKSPGHQSGTIKAADAESFVAVWHRFGSADRSVIYGAITPAKLTAIFNDNQADRPDWRDHRCEYVLKPSREWQTWSDHDRKNFTGNEEFAAWLEDNVPDITDGARWLEIALSMRVNANAAYSKAIRLQDGNVEFGYTNAVEASARASGSSVVIPETFVLNIPVFDGLSANRYDLQVRFRYRLSNGVLSVRYELVRPHKIVELAFRDVIEKVQKDTGATIIYGSPE